MTTLHHVDDAVTVWHGDCIEVLRGLPDCSIDAVVTDPPYGIGFMGKAWDQPGEFGSTRRIGTPGIHRRERGRAAEQSGDGGAMDAGRYDFTANARFQAWVEAWATECLRVLKPGGHLAAFGSTRTYHRLAAGIEDAGFEIRDTLAWMFGSGFPKSLDVSKAIDKTRDDTADVRVVCRWLRARIDEHPDLDLRALAADFGFHPRMVEHWAARDTDSQPALPTLAQWDRLRELLGFGDELDAEVYRLNIRKGEPGEAWADRAITGTVTEWTDRTAYALTSRDGLRRDEPASLDARRWQGWGTALKPGYEPITLARKPLAGTVAANVLIHGTGALNIDACRIPFASSADEHESKDKNRHADFGTEAGGNAVYGDYSMVERVNYDADGRWPANVVLDEVAAAELDLVSGGASRFFYTAKAGRDERPVVDGVAHPTVKPLDVMQQLVRLITPPGGKVLDPFGGSGTTAEACVIEGFQCTIVEREATYLPLIVHRLTRPIQQVIA